MLALRSILVLTTLIVKVWAGTFLSDTNHPLFLNYMILDSQAPQGVGTVILTKSDKDGGQIVSDRQQGIEYKNELNQRLWVHNGNEKAVFVEFPPNGVAQLQSIEGKRLWLGALERPCMMSISRCEEITKPVLKAINEDRFILQEPKDTGHQKAMAHLIQQGLTNAQPKMERFWEYPPRKNPSDFRPIALSKDWDKKLLKEVQYSGKLWWIVHPDFISTSENSAELPFRITRAVMPRRGAYRVIKNVEAKLSQKSISVHVGDFSRILPPIAAGNKKGITFTEPGNWAVITWFDREAPLEHDVYKLLTSWNNDHMKNIKFEEGEVEQAIQLGLWDKFTHSCAKALKQEGSDYELLGKFKAD
ncbi:hypothetical protein PGT21_020164 [Puccinia graminis f. sp. tritici]|uniref:Uncharacterized protein n=2 Tax=Puccinia graminis f. sp. tritici TaxID=56615 RepID=E3L9G9_PUCGT|nr:uncharacterized protein PGTG_19433 [Puccinia graminis f. sp. tritici CRL 75-36-700-3]EFP93194.2 hypothetical protein PGTG_19433 [Puccinia graminis f. sp. tritici CRL 75-36-700-3]KAA1107622.1 hypothetical protein PGT21_020164 [Puccinia graminis f. sp. tritici]KAA1124581.1 hypothetical protein PGTUg99_018831 [Puccinia graminis f. sp. tritici]